jgi:hypothetical protein
MMDAELKKRWVAALRSGEFKQGRYELESEGAFCCLGVLCRIVGIPTRDEAGLPLSATPGHPPGGLSEAEESVLVEMNDNKRKSFREIADYIEANL